MRLHRAELELKQLKRQLLQPMCTASTPGNTHKCYFVSSD